MTIHDESRAANLLCSVPAPGSALELAVEHHIRIFLNSQLAMRLVCTPEHLDELVVGRLFTEGLITEAEEILGLHICGKGLEAKVLLREDAVAGLHRMDAETVSSCCTDNKIVIEGPGGELPQMSPIAWQEEQILSLSAYVLREAPLYRATKAVHSCALAKDGEILCLREDLGRHNALDKVVGWALISGTDLSGCILFTTGRLPADMVTKAIRAGIPLLISKTYPTDRALALAGNAGLTLVTMRGNEAPIVWGP